jgi:hypothetical protein
MACNLYIKQIERAGGNLLGNCSCGQPHLHEIPPQCHHHQLQVVIPSCELNCTHFLHVCILFAFDEIILLAFWKLILPVSLPFSSYKVVLATDQRLSF